MTALFLDTSALVKRYIPEKGTTWLRETLLSANTIIVSQITYVEIISAVARREREGMLNRQIVTNIDVLVRQHFITQYATIHLSNMVTQTASQLLLKYPLRAYDAVQLASATLANARLVNNELAPLTFICADNLLHVAEQEGLQVVDPNTQT